MLRSYVRRAQCARDRMCVAFTNECKRLLKFVLLPLCYNRIDSPKVNTLEWFYDLVK